MNKKATFTITAIGYGGTDKEIKFDDYDKAVNYFKENYEEICSRFNGYPFIWAENWDYREDEDGCVRIEPAVWRDHERIYPY